MKQIKKYDDDERELDDFYFTTNEKDLQSNGNITPPRSFDDSDSYYQQLANQTHYATTAPQRNTHPMTKHVPTISSA